MQFIVSKSENLFIKLLLFHILQSQLRWFGHVSRVSQERFICQIFLSHQLEKDRLANQELVDELRKQLGLNKCLN